MSSRAGIGAAEASALWERAGGSPFWLDLLAGAEGDERDVDAVVAARTRGLGADANLLLGTLAILGRPVDALELEGLVGWPADRCDRATADLVERGLAIDDGGTTRLAHDLIRDVVVSRIPAATRRELEGRIATSLEERAGGEVTVMLAALEHRVAAGSFDADLALRILRAPQRRLIGSDGVGRVVALARDVDDPGVRVRVDEAAASLAAELGDQALALERWSRVAGATTDRALAARADLGAAFAAYDLGRDAEARRWLDAGREAAGETPELQIAADALEARILLWLERRTVEGRRIAMRGVERGRRAIGDTGAAGSLPPGLRTAYVDALIAAWEGAIQAEDVDAIVSLADESLEASRALGLREVLDARAMVGMALEYGATPQDAAGMYRQVWDEAWRAVLPIEAIDAGYRLASALVDGLELDDARRVAGEAERLAARAGDHGRVRDRTRLVKYQVAMATSDWRVAVAAILAAAEDEPDPHYRFVHHQLAALWLARVGVDEDAAIGHTETGTGARGRRGMPRLRPGHGAVGRRGVCPVRSTGGRSRGARQLGRATAALVRRGRVAATPRRCAARGRRRACGRRGRGRAGPAARRGRRRRPGLPRDVDGPRPRPMPRTVRPDGCRGRLPPGRRARRPDRRADGQAARRSGAADPRTASVAAGPDGLDRRRDRRAVGAGARGRRPRRARRHEPRDRVAPVPVAQDGRAPRLERARQARPPLAGGAGGAGRPVRSRVVDGDGAPPP